MVSRLVDGGQPASPESLSLRSRKQRQSRERIYDVAMEQFAERPYDEVTIEQICEGAEVGRATFFRFFGSKAGLIVEFNNRLALSIEEHIARRPAGSATEHLRIAQEEIAGAWEASAPSTREMARAYIRDATAADLRDAGAPELLDLVARIITRGQGDGEFTTRYSARFMAWIVLTALAGVTAGWLGSSEPHGLLPGTRDCLSLLLDGLRGNDG